MSNVVKFTIEDSVNPGTLKSVSDEGGIYSVETFCIEEFRPTSDDPARVRVREVRGRLFVIIETNDTWVWSPKKKDWIDGEALLDELENESSM